MAGIAGVVVSPDVRGRGVGHLPMTAMLDRVASLGFPLSALYPATLPVYRALGWELAGHQPFVTPPTEALRELDRGNGRTRGRSDAVKLRGVGAEETAEILATIARVYEESRFSGPFEYPAYLVNHWLAKEKPFAYLADDAYLEYKWDTSRDIQVVYALARSEETTRALWSLVGSHSSIAKNVTVVLPPNDPQRWLVAGRISRSTAGGRSRY